MLTYLSETWDVLKRIGYRKSKFGGSDGNVWLQAEKGNDPYKTLPVIFGTEHGELNEMLARLSGADDEEREENIGDCKKWISSVMV